jgi:hypothetical protein
MYLSATRWPSLMSSGSARITDFGLAMLAEDGGRDFAGTPLAVYAFRLSLAGKPLLGSALVEDGAAA